MRRLGQPMELEALRRFIINVYIKVVPQYMSDFFYGVDAVELQNIISDDGRAVGPLAAPPKTRVGLDVDRLLGYRQRRA